MALVDFERGAPKWWCQIIAKAWQTCLFCSFLIGQIFSLVSLFDFSSGPLLFFSLSSSCLIFAWVFVLDVFSYVPVLCFLGSPSSFFLRCSCWIFLWFSAKKNGKNPVDSVNSSNCELDKKGGEKRRVGSWPSSVIKCPQNGTCGCRAWNSKMAI